MTLYIDWFLHSQKNYKSWYHEDYEDTPIYIGVITYLCYLVLAMVGYVKDCLAAIGIGRNAVPKDAPKHKVRKNGILN